MTKLIVISFTVDGVADGVADGEFDGEFDGVADGELAIDISFTDLIGTVGHYEDGNIARCDYGQGHDQGKDCVEQEKVPGT